MFCLVRKTALFILLQNFEKPIQKETCHSLFAKDDLNRLDLSVHVYSAKTFGILRTFQLVLHVIGFVRNNVSKSNKTVERLQRVFRGWSRFYLFDLDFKNLICPPGTTL